MIKSIVEGILFYGRQYIARRADNYKMVQKGNPGNFISKLLMIANQDNILGNHLSGIGISHKNARCTSATIQNEIIGKIGSSIILGNTVEEIQNTKLYSTLQLMK